MIGIIVVGHDQLPQEMVKVTRKIIPDAQYLSAVSIDSNAPVHVGREHIQQAIAALEGNDGILLLTDLFGGTPSNLCLAFLQPARVEVISGVNLPMLIKLMNGQQERSFADVIEFIQRYGQKNIVIASHVLEGKIDQP